MILYLLRHGESESNDKKIFASGKVDLPLTPLGIQQALAQAKVLKNKGFTEIYTSPLLRARHTAEIVGDACGIQIVLADELREVDVGWLEGKSMEDPRYWQEWENVLGKWEKGESDAGFRNGETLDDVNYRMIGFFEKLHDPSGPILVVSHCAFFMAFFWLFCANHGPAIEDGHMGRACYSIVKRSDGSFEIEKFNIAPKPEKQLA